MCMHAKSLWSCDPMDCSGPVSSVLGILQARILERVPYVWGSHKASRLRGRMTDEKHLICSGWAWTTLGLRACQFLYFRESWAAQLPRVSDRWFTVGTITSVLDVVRLFSLPKLSPLREWKSFVHEEDFFLMTSCLLNFPATYSGTSLSFSLSELHWEVASSGPCIP